MKRFIKRLFLLFLMSIVSAQAMEVETPEEELPPMHEMFWTCINTKDLKLIKPWINEFNVPVDTVNGFGLTPLFESAGKGSKELVTFLIEKGANVRFVHPESGLTPLHKATRFTNIEAMKLLIQNGADINSPEKNGWTPLHFATIYNLTDAAQLLIDFGAKKDALDAHGNTPFHTAMTDGSKLSDVFKVLLNTNADITVRNKHGNTPFDKVITTSSTDAPIIELLTHKRGNTFTISIQEARAAAKKHPQAKAIIERELAKRSQQKMKTIPLGGGQCLIDVPEEYDISKESFCSLL